MHQSDGVNLIFCSVNGVNGLNVRVSQKWFARFRSGNFYIEEQEPSGRPKDLMQTHGDRQEN